MTRRGDVTEWSAPAAADAVGITYKQMHDWCAAGLLDGAGLTAPGHGRARRLSGHAIVKLAAAGAVARALAEHDARGSITLFRAVADATHRARRIEVPIGDHVTIVVDVAAAVAALPPAQPPKRRTRR